MTKKKNSHPIKYLHYMQHFGIFPLTWCPSYDIGEIRL